MGYFQTDNFIAENWEDAFEAIQFKNRRYREERRRLVEEGIDDGDVFDHLLTKHKSAWCIMMRHKTNGSWHFNQCKEGDYDWFKQYAPVIAVRLWSIDMHHIMGIRNAIEAFEHVIMKTDGDTTERLSAENVRGMFKYLKEMERF